MIANPISYFNKSVDQYNKTYHHFINKKPINADYSALTEKIEINPKASEFKVNDRVRVTKHKNLFSNGYTKNCSRVIFIIDSALKTNPWIYKLLRFKRRKNNRKFLREGIVVEYIINELLCITRQSY